MTKSKKYNSLSPEELAAILAANEKCHQVIREIGEEISTGASIIKKDLSGFPQDSQLVIYMLLEDISIIPVRFAPPKKGMIFIFREWQIVKNQLIVKTNSPELIFRIPSFEIKEWFESFLQ